MMSSLAAYDSSTTILPMQAEGYKINSFITGTAGLSDLLFCLNPIIDNFIYRT